MEQKKPRGRPRKVEANPMDDILSKLVRMETKLEHIQKVTDEQANDIRELRQQVAMGKGGVKVLLWVGGIVGAVLAAWQGLIGIIK